MKCTGCGVELLDTAAFCPYCGAKNENRVFFEPEEPVESVSNTVVVEDKKVWQVFANLAFIFGLISIISSGLSFLLAFDAANYGIAVLLIAVAWELGIPGIVFSILGKKSPSKRKKAKTGLPLNIIAIAVGFVAIFVAAFALVNASGSGYNPDDYYYYMFR